MLKRAGLIILIVALFVAMFTFTALNTGEVELDPGSAVPAPSLVRAGDSDNDERT